MRDRSKYMRDLYKRTRENRKRANVCVSCCGNKQNVKLNYCNACREYHKSVVNRSVSKFKKAVYDFYGNRCSCCGEAEYRFLSIDHVMNDGYKEKKLFGRKLSGFHLYSFIVKAGFPDRFQILCYNCNLGKARNGGICPHVSGGL